MSERKLSVLAESADHGTLLAHSKQAHCYNPLLWQTSIPSSQNSVNNVRISTEQSQS